ncbi:PREDICTED: uncharacterized protein LOC107347578 [Acropora digitifera]|uniref:uncharacterized protein LOC107347578 n=1 Tax=Acropora digitifera TaxID=70779 RepID=UPI00077A9B08|nr:PREDICTED: uncharacterized protein LOC107347578 [Acropora digitifera]
MRQKLKDSIETDLITDTERQRLLSFSEKKATLLVVGQTNSGKSSFVNELLGGSFMPTSELPCTSRIVRLKFSEENYYQVLDDSSPSGRIRTPFSKKKLPREAIELGDNKRGDSSWINAVVEVGLNNPLLQGGHLEVIDAPGMSENEALDTMVDECMHGVLQVIVYVIDGNSSLRLQERGFLLTLKEKIGNLPIFFVCNKIDDDLRAQEFDYDSESEDEGETKPRSSKEKVRVAYQALAKCNMVPKDIPPAECPFFHSLSSKGVRSSRLKKETSHFTLEFDTLKSKLLKFATSGINAHVRVGSELLCKIQDRLFDLFLSCNFEEGQDSLQDDLFKHLEVKELDYYKSMTQYLETNTSTFADVIHLAIKNNKTKIEVEASEMQFDSIKIGNVVGRNEVVEQCRRQIKDIVLFKVMDISVGRVKDKIRSISEKFRSSLETTISEVVKQDNRLADLVTKQLEYSFLQHFQQRGFCQHFDYALMKFGVKMDEAFQAISDVWSAIRGKGTRLNDKWKRELARAVLERIDCHAIAEKIRLNVQADLDQGHQLFLANVEFMKIFCAEAGKNSSMQRTFAAEKAACFSRLISEASALCRTLDLEGSTRVVVGKCLGRIGHRGRVLKVRGNERVVAKQLTCSISLQEEHYLGITRAMRRFQHDAKRVLKPESLMLDKSNGITVLYPRMQTDLFDRLTKCSKEAPILFHDGLRIVLQMIEALESCWDRGLYHIDLRITNVLVEGYTEAKVNVSKPRNDAIMYPDEGPPFHVPDRIPGEARKSGTEIEILKSHCVYSLAILFWLIVEQKYIRPGYAKTDNVTKVYRAIAQCKDSEFIKTSLDQKESKSTQKALGMIVSTFNAQKEKEVMFAWLDNFKSGIQKLLSSTPTVHESTV